MNVRKLNKFIKEQFELAAERCQAEIQPAVERKFRLLQKKYPDFKGVLVGNGTFYFDFTDGSRYDNTNWMNYPEPLRKFHEAISELCQTDGLTYQLIEDLK